MERAWSNVEKVAQALAQVLALLAPLREAVPVVVPALVLVVVRAHALEVAHRVLPQEVVLMIVLVVALPNVQIAAQMIVLILALAIVFLAQPMVIVMERVLWDALIAGTMGVALAAVCRAIR